MKSMPKIIYGTAWKKDKTADLVSLALSKGFRGVDTAAQPKHYNEQGVGEGILRAYEQSDLKREDLFIQTKFSPLTAQDLASVPYDPKASFWEQVSQSIQVSQDNLHTEVIDSWVLHTPLHNLEETLEVWQAMETYVERGQAHQLGLSNCYDPVFFREFFEATKIKPTVLQNRFHQETGYDKEIRAFCRKNKIYYQSFWTLSANPHLLDLPPIKDLAQEKDKTPAQIFFRFLMDQEIVPLTGTTSEEHMIQALEVLHLSLEEDQDRLNSLTHLISS